MNTETLLILIAKTEAKYNASTGREAYKLGKKLRALKAQLSNTK